MQSFTSPLIVLFFYVLSALLSKTNALLVPPIGRAASNTGVAPDSAEAPPISQLSTLKPEEGGFFFNLTAKLPSAGATLKTLNAIPGVCSVNVGAGAKAECQATMTATQITFDDCGDSWTVCRCSDAEMDMSTIVERFSRVPVGLRRYVNTVFVMSDTTPHAYTLTTGDIHFFNDCQMETWIHESAHTFDYASGSPISGTEEWLDAIGNDTCGPDNYSLTNRVEDFAQVTVLKVYELAHDGNLPDGFSADCMQNQLEFMDQLPIYDADTLLGGTCDINVDFTFDLNLGAKKTTAPATRKKVVFPVPGPDSPYVTPTSVPNQPSSLINVAPGPSNKAKAKTNVYDNAARGSVPQSAFVYLIGLVVAVSFGIL